MICFYRSFFEELNIFVKNEMTVPIKQIVRNDQVSALTEFLEQGLFP